MTEGLDSTGKNAFFNKQQFLFIKTRCFPGHNYAQSQSEFITLQETANKSSSAHLGFQVALQAFFLGGGVRRTSRLMKKELYMMVKQHSNNNTSTYTLRRKAADVWDSGPTLRRKKEKIFVAGSGEECV